MVPAKRIDAVAAAILLTADPTGGAAGPPVGRSARSREAGASGAEATMTHTVLISIHAAAGVIAFVAGCVAIRRPAAFSIYFGGLILSVGSLVIAVVEEWTRIDPVSRIVFSGLIVLALVMLGRADRARRLSSRGGTDAALTRYHHMVFTLISLFAAYVVIQVRGLDAPLWVVLGSVVLSSIAGHVTARRFEARALRPITRAPASEPA